MILGEECANPKPHPDPYLEGLKALGTRPEETIICEDSPAGAAPCCSFLPQGEHTCHTQKGQHASTVLANMNTRCALTQLHRAHLLGGHGICRTPLWSNAGAGAQLLGQYRHGKYEEHPGASGWSDTGMHSAWCAGTAAGVAAEIAVVGILSSQTKERMLQAGCSLTVHDYTELLALAKEHEARSQNGKLA